MGSFAPGAPMQASPPAPPPWRKRQGQQAEPELVCRAIVTTRHYDSVITQDRQRITPV